MKRLLLVLLGCFVFVANFLTSLLNGKDAQTVFQS